MTDPLVSEYLPVVRGHIVKHYRWMENRGNCLITVDDLIQIASMTLVKLVEKWDGILEEKGETREGTGPLFWSFLRERIKGDVIKYYARDGMADENESRNPSFDEEPEDNAENQAFIRTSVRIKADGILWRSTHNTIVDFFSVMPRQDKIEIALRYFDDLTLERVADIMEAPYKSTARRVKENTDRWRTFSRNQFTDEITDLRPRLPRAWEPPATLVEYLAARHRKTFEEYLGYVTLCFRSDAGYLNLALAERRYEATGAREGRLSPYFRAQIDTMLGEGESMREISRVLGVVYEDVKYHAKSRHAVS
jgi:DNA-directed RNA polymerase specialized sigma subunit